MNKESYGHSISFDKVEEQEFDRYKALGFTLKGIVRLGMEKVRELVEKKK